MERKKKEVKTRKNEMKKKKNEMKKKNKSAKKYLSSLSFTGDLNRAFTLYLLTQSHQFSVRSNA